MLAAAGCGWLWPNWSRWLLPALRALACLLRGKSCGSIALVHVRCGGAMAFVAHRQIVTARGERLVLSEYAQQHERHTRGEEAAQNSPGQVLNRDETTLRHRAID